MTGRVDWDEGARLAKEASAKRNRETNLDAAETLRLLAQCIDNMAQALEDDDDILGVIAGQGIANHMPALPAHIRHVFIEYLEDEAAAGVKADERYWQWADAKDAA